MNIYDEAKNNIKDIEERLDELDNRVALESIDYLKLFIERAKKVEELLGLYKSVHGVVQSWDTMPNVQKQIEVLEKELEEMK